MSALLVLSSVRAFTPDKDLIGWLGDTYKKDATQEGDAGTGMVVLSWDPRCAGVAMLHACMGSDAGPIRSFKYGS